VVVVVVVVVVSVDDASSEDHDVQSDDVVCLDIGSQAQEDNAEFFDMIHMVSIEHTIKASATF
jgi:hypothetical protein